MFRVKRDARDGPMTAVARAVHEARRHIERGPDQVTSPDAVCGDGPPRACARATRRMRPTKRVGDEMTKRHVIEILYTERCKYLPLAVARVREALALRGAELDVEVRLILVSTFGEAVARRFRGSPSVRIDERDVDTRPGAVAPIGLIARGYVVDGKIERAPSVTSIRRALELAAAEERSRVARQGTAHSVREAVLQAAT